MPEFTYHVSRIAVFGSYLDSSKQKLGDLDIAVELQPRFSANDQKEADKEAARLRAPSYIRLSFIDWLFFAKIEVWRFIKGRRCSVSIHDFDELEKLKARHELIYERADSQDTAQTIEGR